MYLSVILCYSKCEIVDAVYCVFETCLFREWPFNFYGVGAMCCSCLISVARLNFREKKSWLERCQKNKSSWSQFSTRSVVKIWKKITDFYHVKKNQIFVACEKY